MTFDSTRREFIGSAAVAGLAFWAGGSASAAPGKDDKLKVAHIGVGGKGQSDTVDLANGNITLAICDIDRNRLAAMAKELEARGQKDFKLYTDYRKMFDEVKGLDAVSVSTPDHHHAVAGMHALTRDVAVFVQKPFAHTIYECRLMTTVARQRKLASQMGNQGTSSSMLREGVEVIQSGAIGKVKELHVWTNRPVWPQGLDRPGGEDAIPEHIDWECWIGPAPMRPYKNGTYHSFNWRGWYDFGCGALGDMACHTLNLPLWALELGYPTRFWREDSSELKPETFPKWEILKYEFPERKSKHTGEMLPPVTMTWYDGDDQNKHVPAKELFPDGNVPRTRSLLIGDKGVLVSGGDYGSDYKLLPEPAFKDYEPPKPWIPRSPGHMREFTDMVKGGAPAMSNFEYAGFLSEVVLAGCLALHTDKKIEWDGANMVAKNAPEVAGFVDKKYRAGFELVGRELLDRKLAAGCDTRAHGTRSFTIK